MSTQYTASWCLFHALCRYCAWRGTLKSIVSGFLCSLSTGSTSRKNTVCLLLELWPPNINPELMIECRLKAHPTLHLYWKKLFWIKTLSCKVGSMRLPPEWPWRAWRYKIVPEESVQYRYLFLFPHPPAMLPFHLSSDQWGQYKKCFWRFSFNSPELNCSIIFSMHMLSMSKKMNQFLRYFKIGEWIFISLVQHRSKFFSQ